MTYIISPFRVGSAVSLATGVGCTEEGDWVFGKIFKHGGIGKCFLWYLSLVWRAWDCVGESRQCRIQVSGVGRRNW